MAAEGLQVNLWIILQLAPAKYQMAFDSSCCTAHAELGSVSVHGILNLPKVNEGQLTPGCIKLLSWAIDGH